MWQTIKSHMGNGKKNEIDKNSDKHRNGTGSQQFQMHTPNYHFIKI